VSELHDKLREVLAGPNVAVLAAIRPDSTPQQFVVWATMDGDDVLMSTTDDRPKYRNLSRDPHASLVVFPAGDQYSSVHARGTVTFSTEGAAALMDKLSLAYRDQPWAEPPGLGTRVIVRLSSLVANRDLWCTGGCGRPA
jgi:PPOX class probable F420-dependent enzyme